MELPKLPDNADYKDQMLHIIAKFLKKQFKSESSEPDTEPPVRTVEVPVEKIVEKRIEVPVEKIVEKIVEIPDAFTQGLQPFRDIQTAFAQDSDILAKVIGSNSGGSSPEAFVRLMANLAQWDRVVEIWEILAERCKREQRPADKLELGLLQYAVSVHNLTWQNKAAKLESVAVGSEYDYKKVQRGNATGEKVTAVWLPALCNAGGVTEKQALVETA